MAEMGTTWTPEFADQGAFEAGRRSRRPGDYVSSLVDAATLDGKVCGKPWYAGARALIYRKDVLEKAGVAAAQDVGRAAWPPRRRSRPRCRGIYPIGYTGLTEHMYLPTIWQAGGRDRHAGRRHVEVGAEHAAGREAIQFYTDFYKEGLTPEGRDRLGGARRPGPPSSTATSRC